MVLAILFNMNSCDSQLFRQFLSNNTGQLKHCLNLINRWKYLNKCPIRSEILEISNQPIIHIAFVYLTSEICRLSRVLHCTNYKKQCNHLLKPLLSKRIGHLLYDSHLWAVKTIRIIIKVSGIRPYPFNSMFFSIDNRLHLSDCSWARAKNYLLLNFWLDGFEQSRIKITSSTKVSSQNKAISNC